MGAEMLANHLEYIAIFYCDGILTRDYVKQMFGSVLSLVKHNYIAQASNHVSTST